MTWKYRRLKYLTYVKYFVLVRNDAKLHNTTITDRVVPDNEQLPLPKRACPWWPKTSLPCLLGRPSAMTSAYLAAHACAIVHSDRTLRFPTPHGAWARMTLNLSYTTPFNGLSRMALSYSSPHVRVNVRNDAKLRKHSPRGTQFERTFSYQYTTTTRETTVKNDGSGLTLKYRLTFKRPLCRWTTRACANVPELEKLHASNRFGAQVRNGLKLLTNDHRLTCSGKWKPIQLRRSRFKTFR